MLKQRVFAFLAGSFCIVFYLPLIFLCRTHRISVYFLVSVRLSLSIGSSAHFWRHFLRKLLSFLRVINSTLQPTALLYLSIPRTRFSFPRGNLLPDNPPSLLCFASLLSVIPSRSSTSSFCVSPLALLISNTHALLMRIRPTWFRSALSQENVLSCLSLRLLHVSSCSPS